MNWNKAKNLTILFLLILNGFLVILVVMNRSATTVTQEQSDTIHRVLRLNKMSLYSSIPKSYQPMESLQLSQPNMDEELMKTVFLGDGGDITRTVEADAMLYRDGQKTLTLANGSATYENPAGSLDDREASMTTMEQARELCRSFMTQNKKLFSSFVSDREIKTSQGFRIEYRQKYKDSLIFSNSAVFFVTKNGIERIEYTFCEPIEFDGNKKEILSPGEIVLVLVQTTKRMFGDQELIIDRMDLVYYQNETGGNNDTLLEAVPCYRFYLRNMDRPILIHALTGELAYK